MTEDTLARALGALKSARMDDVASDQIRKKLEKAWAERVTRHSLTGFVLPGFVRAFAIAALVVALGFTTLRASADSPLYSARVGIEDALVAFQSDPIAYLTQLYGERLEEAAHFESTGNALAASRARKAQEAALRLLKSQTPRQSEQSPEPSASTAITVPSPSPTEEPAAPTESRTPAPTATQRPAAPTAVRTPTPKPPTPKPPTPTPKPATPKPSPTPTVTPMVIHATGDVLYADGSRVNGACVSMTLDGQCFAGTINGKVDLQLTAKKGQTITLYFRNYDAARGGTLKGKVSVTVGGQEVLLGTTTLRLP